MSVLDEVMALAIPGYQASVRTILQRLQMAIGDAAFQGITCEQFTRATIALIDRPKVEPSLRLLLLSGLSSLGWWCDIPYGDAEIAAMSQTSRRALFAVVKDVKFGAPKASPTARFNHAVFVGRLVGLMHSPTRGSFDYVRALVADRANTRIDVFHTGPLTPEMRAYKDAMLGADASRVRYVCMDTQADWMTQAAVHGPYTYHYWCEDAFAVHIGLLAALGPTVMFTCADLAPVQYADVYWYGQEADYMAGLWARQGAPQGYARNYRTLESTPLNLPGAGRTRTRGELGLPADELIIVSAGNRLGTDLDQPFLDGLAARLRANPQTCWLTVGGLDAPWIAALSSTLGRQFRHIPFDDDLPSLFAQCDIFANPFRAGGGHSSVIAIEAGCIVLTRGDKGDVGALVPIPHRADGEGAYLQSLQTLIDNPDQRQTWKQEQQAYLIHCGDQANFARELAQVNDLAVRRFAGRIALPLEALFDQPISKLKQLKRAGRPGRLR